MWPVSWAPTQADWGPWRRGEQGTEVQGLGGPPGCSPHPSFQFPALSLRVYKSWGHRADVIHSSSALRHVLKSMTFSLTSLCSVSVVSF